MAPGIHPPCTPSASCQQVRCHPTPPPCQDPERCLAETTAKNIKPCKSAVSIMATRSKLKCAECGRFNAKNADNPRNVGVVEDYLDRKSVERKMRREDRLSRSHNYLRYQRSQGTPRADPDCCAGHGHRGRLSRTPPEKKKKKKGKDGSGAKDKKKNKCTIL